MNRISDRADVIARLKCIGLSDRLIAQRLHIGLRSVSRIRSADKERAEAAEAAAWDARRAEAELRDRLLDPRHEWWERAACVGTATRGADPFFIPDRTVCEPPAMNRAEAIALAFCAACPVAAQCLAVALAAESEAKQRGRWGIFGGTTPQQRERIARRTA